MKTYLVICLLLSFVYIVHGEQNSFYVFAQQWSGVFCKVNPYCRRAVANRNSWTIHGLWPSNALGNSSPVCERNSIFDINKLKGLENRLETEWPSYSKSNEKFWAHEWEKHGKCAKKDGNVIAEKTYFSTALELNKKFNILSVLKDNHIVPSLNKLYKVSDIHSALEKSFGVKVQLSCATKEETTYLTETRICLDLHFKKIDCNAMLSCQPDAKVKYIASGSRSIITQHFGSIHPFLFSLLFLLIPLW